MRIRTYPLPNGNFYVLVDRTGPLTDVQLEHFDKVGQSWSAKGGEGCVGVLFASDSIETDSVTDAIEALKPTTIQFSPGGIVSPTAVAEEVQQTLRARGAKIAEGQVDYGQRQPAGYTMRLVDPAPIAYAVAYDGQRQPAGYTMRLVDPAPIAYAVAYDGQPVGDGCLHPEPESARDCAALSRNASKSRVVPLYAGVNPASTSTEGQDNG